LEEAIEEEKARGFSMSAELEMRREEMSLVVAFCRRCAVNNAAPLGKMPISEVKAVSELDARRFAFIADCIERGDHLKVLDGD
jgi:hypothetical protein